MGGLRHGAEVHRGGGRETVALLERLHQFDVLRANKAPFAWGLEPRVPFLDKAFLDVSMGLDPAEKMARPGPADRARAGPSKGYGPTLG